jgi:hypothetical protein
VLFLGIIGGYMTLVLIFGTMHCLSLMLSEWRAACWGRQKGTATPHHTAPCRSANPNSKRDVVPPHSSLPIRPDITTKDLLRDSKLCANPPCCPGGRSPRRLAQTLWSSCLAPVRWRGRRGGLGGGGRAAEDADADSAHGDGLAGGGGGPTGWLLGEGRDGRGAAGGRGGGGGAAADAGLPPV